MNRITWCGPVRRRSPDRAARFDRTISINRADRETFGRNPCGVGRPSHKGLSGKLLVAFGGLLFVLATASVSTGAATYNFLSCTISNSAVSTYTSVNGYGYITETQSNAVNADIWTAQFPTNFPGSGDVQGVRVIGGIGATFTITFDLSNFTNLSASTVFGFYNIIDDNLGTYKIELFDAGNHTIAPPFTWHLIGNEDDALHPQAATHMVLDPSSGVFSTVAYQSGVHSDAAFWDQIPGNTRKIVITGMLGPSADGTVPFFAEPQPPLTITSVIRQSDDIALTWTTPSGTTNIVQVTGGAADGSYATNGFSNLSGQMFIGSGVVTTNYTDVGGATNKPARYYRVRLVQ